MRAASASQSLSAISRRSRSNLRSLFSPLTTSPACFAFHRLSKVFTSLRSGNSPSKPLKLPPFAMWPAFPASDYYEGSVNSYRIGGHTPLASVQVFPSSHAGLNTRARLPIAVFLLACRKSSRISRPSDALSVIPCRAAYISAGIRGPVRTCNWHRFASCPSSGVGRGDLSTLRCVSIGSCSSTVPCSA